MDLPPDFLNNRNNQERKAQIYQRMQDAEIKQQFIKIAEHAFNEAVFVEAVVMSRSERKQLFDNIFRDILTDLLHNIDDA